MYEYFETSKIATVGYYIGGMKQSQLKESEGKQILFGTYSMSSEGMDIPTLNTLILASPKSDIEQSIGRILRKKHNTIVPHVYDICDQFSVFHNQMKKRMAFYKKQHFNLYTIIIDDSLDTPLENIFPLLNKRDKIEYIKKGKKCQVDKEHESILGKGCLI
jgi:superfamily II DNA or RNA helicase